MRGIGEKFRFAVLFVFCAFFSILTFDSVSATDHTATITTSGEVNLSSPAGSTTIGSSNVTVTTNCNAGYNLALVTSVSDNNFYLNGDSNNNEEGKYIIPSDGVATLGSYSRTLRV